MATRIPIVDFIKDPKLCNFPQLSPLQAAFLKTVVNEELNEEEVAAYLKASGLKEMPKNESDLHLLLAGRRSGKSLCLACLSLYFSLQMGMEEQATHGKSPHVVVIAAHRKQAQGVILSYVRGMCRNSPALNSCVEKYLASEITFTNGCVISVYSCSRVTTRGLGISLSLNDEICHWRSASDGAVIDTEVINALRPGLMDFQGSKMVCISSTFDETGFAFDNYRKYYGKDSKDSRVLKCTTSDLNPSADVERIKDEYRRDSEFASVEYGSEWYKSVSQFLTSEAIAKCIGDYQQKPANPRAFHMCAMDLAFKADNAVIVIAHWCTTTNKMVVDHISVFTPGKGRPVKWDDIVERLQELKTKYNYNLLYADQYSSELAEQILVKYRIRLEKVPFSQRSKADMYSSLRDAVNEEMLLIPNHRQLIDELKFLQVRIKPGSTGFSISAPTWGDHSDDIASCLAILAKILVPRQIARGQRKEQPAANTLGGVDRNMRRAKAKAKRSGKSWQEIYKALACYSVRPAKDSKPKKREKKEEGGDDG